MNNIYSKRSDDSLEPLKCDNRDWKEKEDGRHSDWEIIQRPEVLVYGNPTLKNYWIVKCLVCDEEVHTLFDLVQVTVKDI